MIRNPRKPVAVPRIVRAIGSSAPKSMPRLPATRTEPHRLRCALQPGRSTRLVPDADLGERGLDRRDQPREVTDVVEQLADQWSRAGGPGRPPPDHRDHVHDQYREAARQPPAFANTQPREPADGRIEQIDQQQADDEGRQCSRAPDRAETPMTTAVAITRATRGVGRAMRVPAPVARPPPPRAAAAQALAAQPTLRRQKCAVACR